MKNFWFDTWHRIRLTDFWFTNRKTLILSGVYAGLILLISLIIGGVSIIDPQQVSYVVNNNIHYRSFSIVSGPNAAWGFLAITLIVSLVIYFYQKKVLKDRWNYQVYVVAFKKTILFALMPLIATSISLLVNYFVFYYPYLISA